MTPNDKTMSCEELELYLADMMDGELEPERMEALLAHVESCEACRREWQAWQEQETQLRGYFALEREKLAQAGPDAAFLAPVAEAAPRQRKSWSWADWFGASPLRTLAWAAAALVFITFGVSAWQLYRSNVPSGNRVLATLKTAERVQVLEGGAYVALQPGAQLRQGQRIKVAEGGYAALEYPDGNILEVRAGTQVALREFRDHTEVALNRGQVWAHLKAKPRKPYEIVTESKLRAIATGTVYSVQEGLGQTVVAVAEGTVRVEGSGIAGASVSAGNIYTSRPGGESGPIRQLIDWSRYRQDLAALEAKAPREAAGVQQLQAPAASAAQAAAKPAAAPTAPAMGSPEASPLKDLVDALPEDTRALVDIRDWPRVLGQFNSSAYAALAREATLRQWWSVVGGEKFIKEFKEELRLLELVEMAKSLDGQVVLAIVPPAGHFLLLADCRGKEDELRGRIEQLLAGKPDPKRPEEALRMMQDLAKLRDHVIIAKGRLIVSSNPSLARAALERVVSGRASAFKQGDFYKKAAVELRDPLFMAAVNMAGIWPEEGKDKHFDNVMRLAGLRGMDTLLIAPNFAGRGMNQAARLGFSGNRFGAMNWLAEPGPMRGYDFFSSEVHGFISARLRNPRQMFFDYLYYRTADAGEEARRRTLDFFNQHEALFDAFGGEIAVGIENPLLPVANVKIAIELADRATFDKELNLMLKAIIRAFEEKGKMAYVEAADYKGTRIYTFVMDGVPFIQPSWAYVDDFVVIGPGPEFVQSSVDIYASGRSIGNDPHLTSLFPSGSGTNFSLLIYQDAAKALPGLFKNALLSKFGQTGSLIVPDLSFLERYRAPGVAYACAYPKNIDLYLSTPSGIDFNMGVAVPLVANWLKPRIDVSLTADAYADAVVRLGELRQAVGKYKAATGKLPATIEELAAPAGKYISEIPKDPFGENGATLKIAASPDGQGIVLYSIGPDGMDQQGRTELKPDMELDQPGDIVVRVE